MPLISSQLGVLPGTPVVLLKSREGRASLLSNKGIEDDNDSGVPWGSKECEGAVITPLSRQQNSIFSPWSLQKTNRKHLSLPFLAVTESNRSGDSPHTLWIHQPWRSSLQVLYRVLSSCCSSTVCFFSDRHLLPSFCVPLQEFCLLIVLQRWYKTQGLLSYWGACTPSPRVGHLSPGFCQCSITVYGLAAVPCSSLMNSELTWLSRSSGEFWEWAATIACLYPAYGWPPCFKSGIGCWCDGSCWWQKQESKAWQGCVPRRSCALAEPCLWEERFMWETGVQQGKQQMSPAAAASARAGWSLTLCLQSALSRYSSLEQNLGGSLTFSLCLIDCEHQWQWLLNWSSQECNMNFGSYF